MSKICILALFAFVQTASSISAMAKDSNPVKTIHSELCSKDEVQHSASDYPADAGEDIVVVARRIEHNPSGKALLVNCTANVIKSVRVAPDDGKHNHYGREIFDPTYTAHVPGDDNTYPILNFKQPGLLDTRPTDSLVAIMEASARRVCKFHVTVIITRKSESQRLESFFNSCEAYALVIKEVTPDVTLATKNP